MTNSRAESVRAVLREIVGQECTGADNPHGSIVRFDFGAKGHRTGDSADGPRHGWRHLTVQSPWRLQTDAEVLAAWTLGADDESPPSALAMVVGERVVDASLIAPAWDLTIRWANGVALVVFADCDPDFTDAWFILGTDGLEVGVRPGLQGKPGLEVKLPSNQRD